MALALAACSTSHAGESDAGRDGALDAVRDGGSDAGGDGGFDAGDEGPHEVTYVSFPGITGLDQVRAVHERFEGATSATSAICRHSGGAFLADYVTGEIALTFDLELARRRI